MKKFSTQNRLKENDLRYNARYRRTKITTPGGYTRHWSKNVNEKNDSQFIIELDVGKPSVSNFCRAHPNNFDCSFQYNLDDSLIEVTIGIGNDISSEQLLRKACPQCKFYGADPFKETGLVFQKIGKFFQVYSHTDSCITTL